ncbi:GH25 family lysozyme [Pseudarthrobacter sp. J75]|uniref:GH25 family lysozyme n=1 Tax=unclassified Pseudarthrobacter TaxID=2647000 RepID=UPI002E82060C|nr:MULTISPECIES: GH25 family lysozyme [unclassified Pseudarthrobacter]MEE2521401.1 GH25 family lysozyme [Pseudarthrobacter sp. J47]MEE2528633.1 GH25 family lysozyme [Pseudarthrobacter sp. J75]MEE2568324.1 GH25 family lysozyme [Pseudarthrobacter sp. J64]
MGGAGKDQPGVAERRSGGLLSTLSGSLVPGQPAGTAGKPMGIDVSGWQGNVDWKTVKANGAVFAYVKASEGPWTLNDYFSQQYNGAANAGLIRGAYHFARPDRSSGADQARVFMASGGTWTANGITLPPALDLESQPSSYGSDPCYGRTPAQLTAWTQDFVRTMLAATGKAPMIYTGYYFWRDCMGNTSAFKDSNPIWLAAYNSTGPLIPGGWPTYTMWQYSDGTGSIFPGDQNVFNGTYTQLKTLATAADTRPPLSMPAGATPLSGKWGGDGIQYVGWHSGNRWCLQMPMNVNRCFYFGNPGDRPIIGDWDGNGTDGIGIVRQGNWQLANSATDPWVFRAFNFGIASDQPVIGGWEQAGPDSIGVVRGNQWILAKTIWNPYVFRAFYYGIDSDKPVAGDWDANGTDTPGIVRNGQWMLMNSIWFGNIDRSFAYGIGTDWPVHGDWNNDRRDTFGVMRNGTWHLTNDLGRLSVDSTWN